MKQSILLLANLSLVCSISLAQVNSAHSNYSNPLKGRQRSTDIHHPNYALAVNQCQIDSTIRFNTFTPNSIIEPLKVEYYINNAFGQPTSITTFDMNFSFNPADFSLFGTSTLTYNTDGNLVDSIVTQPNGTTFIHVTYTYDGNGNEIEHIKLMDSGSGLLPIFKFVKTYNAANQIVSDTKFDWNGTAYDSTSSNEFTYDSVGVILTEINYTNWAGSAWTNGSKDEYIYNGSGQKISTITYHLAAGVWTEYTKSIYVYDVNNYLIAENGQTWDGASWTDNPCPNYSYSNNASGKPIQIFEGGSPCVANLLYELTYYPNDSLNSIAEPRVDNGWHTIYFDQYGNEIQNVTDWGDDLTPEFPYRITNTYYNCVSVGINPAATPNISLYPNPTTGQFTLEIPTTATYQVEVFNTLGQVVYSSSVTNATKHTINIGNAPVGMYNVRVRNEKNSLSKVLIVD